MKKYITAALIAVFTLGLAACEDDAKIVSKNISKAADNFEINRRIVFYNGITNEYMLEITGLCSLENLGNRLAVTCKVGHQEYKKHFLGLSHNVTYISEQVEGEHASAYHYRVTFKPQTILPDIDFRGSTSDGPNSQ